MYGTTSEHPGTQALQCTCSRSPELDWGDIQQANSSHHPQHNVEQTTVELPTNPDPTVALAEAVALLFNPPLATSTLAHKSTR